MSVHATRDFFHLSKAILILEAETSYNPVPMRDFLHLPTRVWIVEFLMILWFSWTEINQFIEEHSLDKPRSLNPGDHMSQGDTKRQGLQIFWN